MPSKSEVLESQAGAWLFELYSSLYTYGAMMDPNDRGRRLQRAEAWIVSEFCMSPDEVSEIADVACAAAHDLHNKPES